MVTRKVLIVTEVDHSLIAFLEKKKYVVDYSCGISIQEFNKILKEGYEGVIVSTKYILDKKILTSVPLLRWIGRIGSGMENIDIVFAKKKGIHCFSTPEGNCQSVAEHALSLFLSLHRNVRKSFEEIKQGKWLRTENKTYELKSMSVGIIGYGNTGMAFAQLLKKIGVKVLVYDKYKKDFAERNIIETSLEHIFQECNVISIHLPLNSETSNYCNRSFFSKLKQKPIFINTSRGNMAMSKNILYALEKKYIIAAGLDVLDNENLQSYTKENKDILHKLMSFPNLLITSHIAGNTFEAKEKMSAIFIKKLKPIIK